MTLLGILVAALALGGGLVLFSLATGSLPPASESEAFFGYFGNSIGLAIGAAGTIAAIVLAYNALRTSEIQTTTVALQEFRPEIDSFIENSNKLYFHILDLIHSGLQQNLAAHSLTYAIHDHIHADIVGTLRQPTSVEEVKAYATDFVKQRKAFIAAADEIHSVLDGNGNIFFRQMITENIKSCQEEINAIRELQRQGYFIPMSNETPSDEEVVRHLNLLAPNHITTRMRTAASIREIKSLIYAVRFGAAYAEITEENFLSLIAEQLPKLTIDPVGADWDDEKWFRNEEVDNLSLITDIKPRTEWLDDSRYWLSVEEGPEDSIAIDISEKKVDQASAPYELILKIYFKLVKPDTGIEAMRQHFAHFGAQEDLLHLFIDTHEARLAYNYRKETHHLFSRAIPNQETSGSGLFSLLRT